MPCRRTGRRRARGAAVAAVGGARQSADVWASVASVADARRPSPSHPPPPNSQLAGGGVVPLTRAVCCRPCLPRGRSAAPTPALGRRAPASAPTAPRADALAVLSLDCHPAPADGPNSLLCEAGTGGFVAGWARAADVPSLPGAAYPLGPPRCCTPVS